MSDLNIPAGYGICPCCKGTKRVPLSEHDAWLRTSCSRHYDKVTDTKTCQNCGGQTMSGTARGFTTLDPGSTEGCLHSYISRNAGRCRTDYTCITCASYYQIDSGD